MKHIFFCLVASLLIIGCNSDKKEANKKNKVKSEKTTSSSPIIGKKNYAVVWNWVTKNEDLVTSNAAKISNELNALWQKGIVENAYYNSDSKVDKLSNFPNISFSIKANSYKSAEVLLNNLTVVKKGIAVYKLYPIGTLWLARNNDIIQKIGIKKSFVTVWTTTKKPSQKLTQEQNDTVLKLWNTGKVENIYFDIQGTQKANNKTDFVFYTNANTLSEAKAICESLPFFKEKIATYKIREVGVFWMGKYGQK